MKQPTVVNRHHFHDAPLPAPHMYIGRPGALGNPFTVQEHGPKALDLYRRWLWVKVKGQDPAVMKALRAITSNHHLVCFCKPGPCHGDIVVRAWGWLQRQATKSEKTT